MKLILVILAFSFAWGQSPSVRPKFSKRKILVGERKITVEIADTEFKRSYGLMFVESLPLDQGMLFIFESAEPRSFWMKNTLIPLSIGYFDQHKELVGILEMEPEILAARELKTYPSPRPAQYALEMNKGWFIRNGIRVGQKFRFVE